MYLFPAEGIMLTILSYGQLISLFLVLVIFEGMIAAKSETGKSGLVFIGLIFLLAVGVGVYFGEFTRGNVSACLLYFQKNKGEKFCKGRCV